MGRFARVPNLRPWRESKRCWVTRTGWTGANRGISCPRRGVMSGSKNLLRRCAFSIAAAGLTLVVAACGSSGGGSGGSGKKVYMLLPNTTTVRFVSQDGPKFKSAKEKQVPGAKVIVQNAENDPSKQVQQVETAISAGADAIVLVAADPYIAGGALQKAQQAKVPVI